MADLIVKAAVKEALDDQNVASDFYEALDVDVVFLSPGDHVRRSDHGGQKRSVGGSHEIRASR